MKRLVCALLVCLFLAGCAPHQSHKTTTYLDVFDTVTTVIGDPAAAERIHRQLQRYHQLFDIYNTYEGIHNLKTINDQAGVAPVKVDEEIIALLSDCVELHQVTYGRVNVAMGSVLKLWHDARQDSLANPEKAYIPSDEVLAEATRHTDIDCLVIDREKSTVYLTDPEMTLDVGAIAKGWAAQKVAESAPEGMLISLGGNVVATGPKEEGTPWIVGVQDPKGSDIRQKLELYRGAIVTSGDYQRTYTVDGKDYPHIIDPSTGMPGMLWSSVTVLCQDSALADALSTALFLLPLSEGKDLAKKCGAEVLWIDKTGNLYATENML